MYILYAIKKIIKILLLLKPFEINNLRNVFGSMF